MKKMNLFKKLLILSLAIMMIFSIAGCKKKPQQPDENTTENNVSRVLTVTAAKEAKKNPIKTVITFTFKGDKIEAVHYDETYTSEKDVRTVALKYGKQLDKYASVQYTGDTHPVMSYNLVDLSKWEKETYSSVKSSYEKDSNWIVTESEITITTTEAETTEATTKAKK